MSAFKVGDLVDSPRFDRAGGTVVEIRDVYVKVEWPGMTLHYEYHRDELRLIAAVTPVAVAATLETATGDDLDGLAWSQWGASRDNGETDEQLREWCRRYGYTAERDLPAPPIKFAFADDTNRYLDSLQKAMQRAYDGHVHVGPVVGLGSTMPGSSGVTQAEWSDAIAKTNAQAKALDTVRRFLAGHSFAACSLACNRELREVMAQVLAALDADKAAK